MSPVRTLMWPLTCVATTCSFEKSTPSMFRCHATEALVRPGAPNNIGQAIAVKVGGLHGLRAVGGGRDDALGGKAATEILIPSDLSVAAGSGHDVQVPIEVEICRVQGPRMIDFGTDHPLAGERALSEVLVPCDGIVAFPCADHDVEVAVAVEVCRMGAEDIVGRTVDGCGGSGRIFAPRHPARQLDLRQGTATRLESKLCTLLPARASEAKSAT